MVFREGNDLLEFVYDDDASVEASSSLGLALIASQRSNCRGARISIG